MIDGSATPGGGNGPNEETDPYNGYPYIAPTNAIIRMTAHAADGSLLGASNLRDPSRIRPLLEQSLTTTQLEPYSNGTAWSSTLPWHWMKEGTKITIGAIDPSSPERLLTHELTLHKLAMWGRHTLTRTKVLIFGDQNDVEALDTSTHSAEKLVNGMFGAMPTSELHWVDSPDWHLPCIVQGTNAGPAKVCSEAERRAALLAAGQNDTGSEPGWDILKNQFALKANNANNGRGLANSSIYFLADDPAVGPTSRQWWGSDSTGDSMTIPLTASQCDDSNSNGLVVSASVDGQQKTTAS